MLIKAGIAKTDALAAVTASDEANVVAARIAKQVFRVPRVAARIYDPRKAEIYRRLGIQTISPVALGASRLAELLSFTHLDTKITLGTGEVEIIGVEIPAALAGRTVSDVDVPGQVRVITLSRSGKMVLPVPGTAFLEGDLINLAVAQDQRDRISAMFR